MKHNIEFKNWSPDGTIRELIETSIARLDTLVPRAWEDSAFLRVLMEENPTRTLYRVSVSLAVPGPDITAQAEHHDPIDAVRDAFTDIERQIATHRDRLTRSHEYKREARREQLRRLKSGVTGS
jgi:ribosome-associated translation inhibitor RaiA